MYFLLVSMCTPAPSIPSLSVKTAFEHFAEWSALKSVLGVSQCKGTNWFPSYRNQSPGRQEWVGVISVTFYTSLVSSGSLVLALTVKSSGDMGSIPDSADLCVYFRGPVCTF